MVASDAHTIVTHVLKNVMAGPTVERRGSMVREMRGPCHITLTDPLKRMHSIISRRGDPWVMLAEFPWIIAGRNDIEWLQWYLPRAKDFSDDGVVWRAGYGPRMREHVSLLGQHTDQLHCVVQRLKEDGDTRQAVMTLWDPGLDNVPNSADYPCTLALHFIVAGGGALDLHVNMRSNDVLWGFSGVNIVNFTLLQELVAHLVNMPVGKYHHTSNNMHVYEHHWEQAGAIISASNSVINPYYIGLEPASMLLGHDAPDLEHFTDDCHSALQLVTDLRSAAMLDVLPVPEAAELLGVQEQHWLARWVAFMNLHGYLHGPPAATFAEASKIVERAFGCVPDPAWRLALAMWLLRGDTREWVDDTVWEPLMTDMLREVLPHAPRRDLWIQQALRG